MSSFDVDVRIGSEVEPLHAQLEVSEGRLRISTAHQIIGDWDLLELDFERIPNGYKVAIEDEMIVLSVPDPLRLEEALANGNSFTRHRTSGQPTTRSNQPVSTPRSVRASGQVVGSLKRNLTALDQWLEKGRDASGPDWPDWIFSRATIAVVLLLVILLLVIPGVVSTGFVLGGLALVVLGTLLSTDHQLARRWLPGRTTPVHVLLAGTGLALTGVLIGLLNG